MRAVEFLKLSLVLVGADGLVNTREGCSCTLDNFAPCGGCISDCELAEIRFDRGSFHSFPLSEEKVNNPKLYRLLGVLLASGVQIDKDFLSEITGKKEKILSDLQREVDKALEEVSRKHKQSLQEAKKEGLILDGNK